ncbi:MAG: hypothetical protein QGI73_03030 [Candidatus Thalassarchaeaceae archaeon]|jgi:hypothetical protein|nr:hypothetical protein [Euryarchaeota archaeon]MDP6871188.1 hypothetical protein [Candidatus Thalassarchaeaceae archaeon]
MTDARALPNRSDSLGRYSSPWPERLVFSLCLVCSILLIPKASGALNGHLAEMSLIGAIASAAILTPLVADLLIRVMYRAMKLR